MHGDVTDAGDVALVQIAPMHLIDICVCARSHRFAQMDHNKRTSASQGAYARAERSKRVAKEKRAIRSHTQAESV